MPAISIDTRTAILDAAERAFAEDGLRGARTERIAEDVGITKAMINYYFGTKDKLYAAVLERIHRERARGMNFESLHALPPLDALQAFVVRLLEQMNRKPYIAPLFALENIQNRGRFYGQSGASTMLVTIIERGIASGAFRATDPRHAAVNVMGVCLHYFNVMTNVRHLWARRPQRDKELLHEHATYALDFVLAAVKA